MSSPARSRGNRSSKHSTISIGSSKEGDYVEVCHSCRLVRKHNVALQQTIDDTLHEKRELEKELTKEYARYGTVRAEYEEKNQRRQHEAEHYIGQLDLKLLQRTEQIERLHYEHEQDKQHLRDKLGQLLSSYQLKERVRAGYTEEESRTHVVHLEEWSRELISHNMAKRALQVAHLEGTGHKMVGVVAQYKLSVFCERELEVRRMLEDREREFRMLYTLYEEEDRHRRKQAEDVRVATQDRDTRARSRDEERTAIRKQRENRILYDEVERYKLSWELQERLIAITIMSEEIDERCHHVGVFAARLANMYSNRERNFHTKQTELQEALSTEKKDREGDVHRLELEREQRLRQAEEAKLQTILAAKQEVENEKIEMEKNKAAVDKDLALLKQQQEAHEKEMQLFKLERESRLREAELLKQRETEIQAKADKRKLKVKTFRQAAEAVTQLSNKYTKVTNIQARGGQSIIITRIPVADHTQTTAFDEELKFSAPILRKLSDDISMWLKKKSEAQDDQNSDATQQADLEIIKLRENRAILQFALDLRRPLQEARDEEQQLLLTLGTLQCKTSEDADKLNTRATALLSSSNTSTRALLTALQDLPQEETKQVTLAVTADDEVVGGNVSSASNTLNVQRLSTICTYLTGLTALLKVEELERELLEFKKVYQRDLHYSCKYLGMRDIVETLQCYRIESVQDIHAELAQCVAGMAKHHPQHPRFGKPDNRRSSKKRHHNKRGAGGATSSSNDEDGGRPTRRHKGKEIAADASSTDVSENSSSSSGSGTHKVRSAKQKKNKIGESFTNPTNLMMASFLAASWSIVNTIRPALLPNEIFGIRVEDVNKIFGFNLPSEIISPLLLDVNFVVQAIETCQFNSILDIWNTIAQTGFYDMCWASPAGIDSVESQTSGVEKEQWKNANNDQLTNQVNAIKTAYVFGVLGGISKYAKMDCTTSFGEYTCRAMFDDITRTSYPVTSDMLTGLRDPYTELQKFLTLLGHLTVAPSNYNQLGQLLERLGPQSHCTLDYLTGRVNKLISLSDASLAKKANKIADAGLFSNKFLVNHIQLLLNTYESALREEEQKRCLKQQERQMSSMHTKYMDSKKSLTKIQQETSYLHTVHKAETDLVEGDVQRLKSEVSSLEALRESDRDKFAIKKRSIQQQKKEELRQLQVLNEQQRKERVEDSEALSGPLLCISRIGFKPNDLWFVKREKHWTFHITFFTMFISALYILCAKFGLTNRSELIFYYLIGQTGVLLVSIAMYIISKSSLFNKIILVAFPLLSYPVALWFSYDCRVSLTFPWYSHHQNAQDISAVQLPIPTSVWSIPLLIALYLITRPRFAVFFTLLVLLEIGALHALEILMYYDHLQCPQILSSLKSEPPDIVFQHWLLLAEALLSLLCSVILVYQIVYRLDQYIKYHVAGFEHIHMMGAGGGATPNLPVQPFGAWGGDNMDDDGGSSDDIGGIPTDTALFAPTTGTTEGNEPMLLSLPAAHQQQQQSSTTNNTLRASPQLRGANGQSDEQHSTSSSASSTTSSASGSGRMNPLQGAMEGDEPDNLMPPRPSFSRDVKSMSGSFHVAETSTDRIAATKSKSPVKVGEDEEMYSTEDTGSHSHSDNPQQPNEESEASCNQTVVGPQSGGGDGAPLPHQQQQEQEQADHSPPPPPPPPDDHPLREEAEVPEQRRPSILALRATSPNRQSIHKPDISIPEEPQHGEQEAEATLQPLEVETDSPQQQVDHQDPEQSREVVEEPTTQNESAEPIKMPDVPDVTIPYCIPDKQQVYFTANQKQSDLFTVATVENSAHNMYCFQHTQSSKYLRFLTDPTTTTNIIDLEGEHGVECSQFLINKQQQGGGGPQDDTTCECIIFHPKTNKYLIVQEKDDSSQEGMMAVVVGQQQLDSNSVILGMCEKGEEVEETPQFPPPVVTLHLVNANDNPTETAECDVGAQEGNNHNNTTNLLESIDIIGDTVVDTSTVLVVPVGVVETGGEEGKDDTHDPLAPCDQPVVGGDTTQLMAQQQQDDDDATTKVKEPGDCGGVDGQQQPEHEIQTNDTSGGDDKGQHSTTTARETEETGTSDVPSATRTVGRVPKKGRKKVEGSGGVNKDGKKRKKKGVKKKQPKENKEAAPSTPPSAGESAVPQ